MDNFIISVKRDLINRILFSVFDMKNVCVVRLHSINVNVQTHLLIVHQERCIILRKSKYSAPDKH